MLIEIDGQQGKLTAQKWQTQINTDLADPCGLNRCDEMWGGWCVYRGWCLGFVLFFIFGFFGGYFSVWLLVLNINLLLDLVAND